MRTAVEVDAAIDADLTCVCSSAAELSCGTGTTSCALGCINDPVSTLGRCRLLDPSNGLQLVGLDALDTEITISGGTATFDTDTGAITGVITRPQGEGVVDNIGFGTEAAIGVFTLHRLTVSSSGTIRFTGTRAVAFIVETTATIDGLIVGSGGCTTDSSCPGPGGGTGGYLTPATGCGPGGSTATDDNGGGGGGGGTDGGKGGIGTIPPVGAGGLACIAATAEPLVGGSGGGIGDPGSTTLPGRGGGGGGGLQLSALDAITIAGTIDMGGAGGGGGPVSAANSAGGSGGGAGGAILIEAPVVTLAASARLAANGGGGGGGGYTGGQIPGGDGMRGGTTAVPANGGISGGGGNGVGGKGGAGTTAAAAAPDSVGANAGGGGGAFGVIYLRALGSPMTTGAIITPAAGTGPVRIRD